jgi:LysR family hca operon transcriptional activator
MLAEDLKQSLVDIAFLRHEPDSDLVFKPVLKESLVAILPRKHRLATRKTLDPHELAGETFIGISEISCVLGAAVDGYLKRAGVKDSKGSCASQQGLAGYNELIEMRNHAVRS